jgi:hypothetical protein
MSHTIDTAVAALQSGNATLESIAAETGWPIVDGVLVPEPNMWHADDGNAELVEEHASSEEAAQSYVDGGDWGNESQTCWIRVGTWREGIDEDGDIVLVNQESHKITIDPEEPECLEGQEHGWQSPLSLVGGIKENPGVYGHGGGVTISEVCMRCGCGKTTDGWAQDPSDGEQGLDSVSYESGKYTAAIQRMHEAEVREFVEAHQDDDEFDDEELVRMFVLAYDREPDESEREQPGGLWSEICAAVL